MACEPVPLEMQQALRQLLAVMPTEWLGTTFRNTDLLGREGFSVNLQALLASKATITTDALVALGEAEDYLRVATNVSTTLETVLALQRGLSPSHVFSFASTTMPIIAVCLAVPGTVHLLHGSDAPVLSVSQQRQLALLGGRLTCHAGPPPTQRPDGIVLYQEQEAAPPLTPAWAVDGVVGESVLYITQVSHVDPAQILTLRKRLATPATTPDALARLCCLAGLADDAHADAARAPPAAAELDELHAHLQVMCGAPADAACPPLLCSAGLPALASLWAALGAQGGADVVMSSTAYGGSAQVTELLEARMPRARLRRHAFHIQGDAPVNGAIAAALCRLREAAGKGSCATEVCAYPVSNERAPPPSPPPRRDESRTTTPHATAAAAAAALLPTTLVFVEVPSNPDMKVPDLAELAAELQAFQALAQTRVVLLVDTTFAPASRALARLREAAPRLPAVCFTSLSKAVSAGRTTAGMLVANHMPHARALVGAAAELCALLDVGAKPAQLRCLAAHHRGVEERCRAAHAVAAELGGALCAAVAEHAPRPMRLHFVSEEAAAAGFSSPTFSFNLPPPAGASATQAAALAQRFVDALTAPRAPRAPPLFKPCVSFGQDCGAVYCTVPATSTQGAVQAEHKAKQAVGGVQLVRLSFPPAIDMAAAAQGLRDAVAAIYAQ